MAWHTLIVLSADPLKRPSPGSKSEKHVTAFLCSFMSNTSVADCPLTSHTYIMHTNISSSFYFFLLYLLRQVDSLISYFIWVIWCLASPWPYYSWSEHIKLFSTISFFASFFLKDNMKILFVHNGYKVWIIIMMYLIGSHTFIEPSEYPL